MRHKELLNKELLMKLITLDDFLFNFIDKWKALSWTSHHGWNKTLTWNGQTAEEIYNKLLACNPLTKQDIINILGDSSQIDIQCVECRKVVDRVVSFNGYAGDLSLRGCHCIDCVKKALTLMGG